MDRQSDVIVNHGRVIAEREDDALRIKREVGMQNGAFGKLSFKQDGLPWFVFP